MATLTLEPDEVFPTTPAPLEDVALGPFPMVWRGKERQFWLRAVELRRSKHVVFACEVGNEAVGNWLIYERKTLTPARWSPGSPERKLAKVDKEFDTRDWGLARFFHCPGFRENHHFGLLLGDNNLGAWLDKEFRTASAFDFHFQPELFECGHSRIRQFLKSQVEEEESTIGFAARWASPYLYDRFDLVYRGLRAELEQVMQWTLRCEKSLWEQENEWSYSVGAKAKSQNYTWLSCSDGRGIGHPSLLAVEFEFVRQVSRFLVEDCIPTLTASRREKHRPVRDFFELEYAWMNSSSKKPAAHEQIEAALNLRDWLRKNHAPAELLALLPS